jgi:hypothetical protein
MSYKIVPISSEIAQAVRENMVSPQYGHPAHAETAAGYGPCRQCLKTFVEGVEERILFTYNSFSGLSDLPLPGPIFIHKNECQAFDGSGFPPELISLPLLFEGFADESRLVSREAVDGNRIDRQIEEIFSDPETRFINLRNSEAGCFVARIDRL